MSREFKIFFLYNDHYYRARVVKSVGGDEMIYAIRPLSRKLAKGYGQQTLILKKNNHFRCDGMVNKTSPEYIKALVSALREQDILRSDIDIR